MNRFLTYVIVIAHLFLIKTVSAAGIPVIDTSSIAKSIEQITQMKTQIDNQIKQITELRSQVAALTNTHNLGSLAKESVTDAIPDDWRDLYKVTDIDLSKIKDINKFDPQAHLKNLLNIDQLAQQAMQQIKPTHQNIEKLLNEINNSSDIKASTELQNRIAIEQATLQLNQTRLDQMHRVYEINEKVIHEQAVNTRKCQLKDWNPYNSSCSN